MLTSCLEIIVSMCSYIDLYPVIVFGSCTAAGFQSRTGFEYPSKFPNLDIDVEYLACFYNRHSSNRQVSSWLLYRIS